MNNNSKPEKYTDCGEEIMSNLDLSIDEEVAENIKGKPLFAQYSGWNFCGYVWHLDNQWHCDIWTYNSYQQTFTADTLKEIMDEVCTIYGYE